MTDYFQHFGLQPGFLIDESLLRKEYLRLQKLWHPDYFASDPFEMDRALQFTALNNEAFKTLQSFENRIRYILTNNGLWKEGEKHNLPQDFLMDMLDLNDLILEASIDPTAKQNATLQLNTLTEKTMSELRNLAEKADQNVGNWNAEYLEPLRNEFEKLRYLSRLQKNLEGGNKAGDLD